MRRSPTNDRNALAEIRQSYLLRQSIIGDRYRNPKNPYFNIKPDYYDYRTLSDFRNCFVPERPALPYYVVPVLYVPQKVVSTDDESADIEERRALSRRNQKNVQQAPEPDYEYQDEEPNGDDLENLDGDLGSKSGESFTHRTNSGSTVEISSLSSHFEEVSESFKTDRFNKNINNYNKGFENGLNTGIYKYPIKQNVFGGETCKFDDSKKNSSNHFNMGEQQKHVFWKYKNPYTIFNKYPLTPKENKNSSHEEGFESEMKCNHFESEELKEKRKQKICIDCLKDKYLTKDLQCRKSSKNLQTNFGFSEFEVFNNTSSRKTSVKGVEGDTKSTQTLSAAKINSGTQTEIERKLTYRNIKGSHIPQRTTNGLKSSYTELVKRNEKSYGSTSSIKKRTEEV